MKYKDIKNTEKIPDGLPFYSREKWKFLWENDRYDGPLEGVCEVEGKKYYFLFHDDHWYKLSKEDMNKVMNEELSLLWTRSFYLADLSEEQWEKEIKRHEDFCKYVGTYCNYNENGCLLDSDPKPEWQKFYDIYGEDERDYDDYEIVGWIAI